MCAMYMCDVTCFSHVCDIAVWYDWVIHVTCFSPMCAMAYLYVWRDVVICVPWLIYMFAITRSHTRRLWLRSHFVAVWRVVMTHVTSLCDMTGSYVWHDIVVCVPWLIHTCAITHSYTRRLWLRSHLDAGDVFSWHVWLCCVIWLDHICNMTKSYVCHGWVIRVPWLIHIRNFFGWGWTLSLCDVFSWHVWLCCKMWLGHVCDVT